MSTLGSVLRPFTFSTTTSFVLEFGDFYLRFFTNRQQVTTTAGPFEIVTPYALEHVRKVQWTQINDEVRLTHPLYHPQLLTRNADNDWDLVPVPFDEPPFLKQNVTAATLAASAITGAGITLTAGSAIFAAGHVGASFKIEHKAPGAQEAIDISANGSSAALRIFGDWTLRTYGNWGADIAIERSDDGTTGWEQVSPFHGEIVSAGVGSRNLNASGKATEFSYYRITITNYDAGTVAGAYATLERAEALVHGVARIVAVGTGGTTATADVIEDLFSTDATLLWNEGAWSELRGFPRCVTIHEQRAVYASTEFQPFTIWGSKIDEFENFTEGLLDSAAYSHTLAATGRSVIQWLQSREALLVGSSFGIWRVRGDGFGNPITPTRIDAKRRNNRRAEYIPAEQVGDPVVFVGLKNRKLFALVYDEGGDRFQIENLTLLAEHITLGGLLEMAWQEDKQILWCVRTDGVLVALTYDAEEQVVGWHEHRTDGFFRSVTTIIGDNDSEDEVWVIVERTIGSEQVFFVEMIDPDTWTTKPDAFYVDSGLSYAGVPASHFSGLLHLAGRAIAGLADGRVFAATVDTAGEFDLPTGFAPASTVHAGLPYEYELQPFRLDADSVLGVHIGRKKKIDGLSVRVMKTVGANYEVGGESFPMVPPEGSEGTDPDNPPLLGDARAQDIPISGFQQDATYDPTITIKGSDPLPCSVLSLSVAYSLAES
jgi:hypothetical protein